MHSIYAQPCPHTTVGDFCAVLSLARARSPPSVSSLKGGTVLDIVPAMKMVAEYLEHALNFERMQLRRKTSC